MEYLNISFFEFSPIIEGTTESVYTFYTHLGKSIFSQFLLNACKILHYIWKIVCHFMPFGVISYAMIGAI